MERGAETKGPWRGMGCAAGKLAVASAQQQHTMGEHGSEK